MLVEDVMDGARSAPAKLCTCGGAVFRGHQMQAEKKKAANASDG